VRAPTAAELLGVWERSADSGPVARANALLELAAPDEPVRDLALGERDARLLELRELLFGEALDGAADCARCGETLAFSLSTEAVRAGNGAFEKELTVSASGYDLRFRLPTVADLAAASSSGDLADTRARLLERCVLTASHAGHEAAPASLPPSVVEALAELMAEADPLGDLRVALTCPACGNAWAAVFDIAAWLWSEIEAWARRLVVEVHTLASAYGWSEGEILALGARRELYLDLVAG